VGRADLLAAGTFLAPNATAKTREFLKSRVTNYQHVYFVRLRDTAAESYASLIRFTEVYFRHAAHIALQCRRGGSMVCTSTAASKHRIWDDTQLKRCLLGYRITHPEQRPLRMVAHSCVSAFRPLTAGGYQPMVPRPPPPSSARFGSGARASRFVFRRRADPCGPRSPPSWPPPAGGGDRTPGRACT
jgi:hypothetical protein